MNLFAKEKELILKLTNAILIIWLISALCFVVSNITELVVKEEKLNYDDYSTINCNYTVDVSEKDNCNREYLLYYDNDRDVSTLRSFIISLSNVIIVGGSLYLLNKPKRKS